jgi:DNA-binding phage protein
LPLTRTPPPTPPSVSPAVLRIEEAARKFASALRMRTDAVGMRHVDLARAASLPVSTISRVLGGTRNPRLSTFLAILEALSLRIVVVPADCELVAAPAPIGGLPLFEYAQHAVCLGLRRR